jgi:hypothetical protein
MTAILPKRTTDSICFIINISDDVAKVIKNNEICKEIGEK